MQVTETLSEGLKREFKVVVPAAELDAKVNARLDELKDRVRINGFRPGKVPVAHLKRVYGRSAMAEVIEATVRDANNQIVSERGFKLAADPKVTLPTEEGAVEKLIAGKSDLDYTMAVEIVPPIDARRFQDHQAHQAYERRHRRRSRRGHRPHRRAEQALYAEGRRREGGQGRPRHHLLCRHHRRQAVRRRHRRRRGRADRIEHLHSRLRGSADRHRQRRNPHAESDVPGALRASRRWPARTPSSSSPPSRSRRPARSRSTTNSPNRSAWNCSPSCATRSRSASRASITAMSRQKLKRALLDELDKLPQVRAAADAGRGGVRPRVEVGARRIGEREARPSPTRTPPRKRPRPNTAPSPSGGCGSAWCWPRSARRTPSP